MPVFTHFSAQNKAPTLVGDIYYTKEEFYFSLFIRACPLLKGDILKKRPRGTRAARAKKNRMYASGFRRFFTAGSAGLSIELSVRFVQRFADDVVHIVILVLPQPSAENDALFLVREFFILQIEFSVLFVVDGIVRLVAEFPSGGVFAGDDRLGLCAEFKVFVFDDARERGLGVRIVDDGVALKIVRVQHFRFKAHASVFQRAETVIVKAVDGARIDDGFGAGEIILLVVEKVGVEPHLAPFQHLLDDGGISADRNALIAVVEIVVVEDETHGQTLDDKCG